MSLNTLCRLCLCPFQNDYKILINTDGQCSEAYDITSKYFDPMLFLAGQEDIPPILCVICWQRIQDFNYFQQTIYKTHCKLEDIKDIVKVEVEHVQEQQLMMFSTEITNKTEIPADKIYYLRENDNFSSENEKILIKSQQDIKKSFVKQKINKHKPQRKRKVYRTARKLKNADCVLKSKCLNDFALSVGNENICNINDKIYFSRKTLENDAIIAAFKSQLECAKCNATFANFSLLKTHYHIYHSDEKCYVACCDRKFYNRYHIIEHINLHMNPNAYRCKVCGRCSTNSRNLARHIKTHYRLTQE